MAKKSAADQKAEAAEIGDYINKARKRPLNFALLIAKDGVVLEAHPTKGPDVMRRQAKAKGGTPKGTQGVMNVSGKILQLTCEDEDFPPNLGKVAKKHFAELGIACRVVLLGPSGQPIGESDEDDDEDEVEVEDAGSVDAGDDAAREDLKKRAQDLEKEIKKAADKIGDAAGGLVSALADFLKSGVEDKIEDATEALDALQKQLEDARENAGKVSPDALRAALEKEFAQIEDKLKALVDSGQAGVAKKAEALSSMFQKELDGDLKKAGNVLSLLKGFVQTESSKLEKLLKGAGDTVSGAAGKLADGVEKTAGQARTAAKGVFGKLGKAAGGVFGKAKDAANGVARAAAKVAGKLAQSAGVASAAAQTAADTAQGALDGAGQAVSKASGQAGRAVAQVGEAAAELATKAKEAVEAAEEAARIAAREAERAAKQAADAAERAAAAAQAAVDEADESAAKAADKAAAAARKLAEAARQTAEAAARQAVDTVQQVEDAANAAIDTAQRAAEAAEGEVRGLLGTVEGLIAKVAGGAEDGAEALIGLVRDATAQAETVAAQVAARAGAIGDTAKAKVGGVQAEIEGKLAEAIAVVTAIAQRLADNAAKAEQTARAAADMAQSVADDAVAQADGMIGKVADLVTDVGTTAAGAAREAADAARAAAGLALEAAKTAESAAARATDLAGRLASAVGRAANGVLDRAAEDAAEQAANAARKAQEAAEAAAADALRKVAEAQRLADKLQAEAQAEADRKITEAKALFDRLTNPFERAADAVGDEAKLLLDQATTAGADVAGFFGGVLADLGAAGGKIQQAAGRIAEGIRREAQQGVDGAIDAIERTRLEIQARIDSKIARIEARAEAIATEAQRRADAAKAEAEALKRDAEAAAQAAFEDGGDLVNDGLRLARDAAVLAATAAAAAALEAAASAAAIRAALKSMRAEAKERVEDFLDDFSEDAIQSAEDAANEAARKAEAALNDARARAADIQREVAAAQAAIKAEIERKRMEAEALLGQVEMATAGVLGGGDTIVNGAIGFVEENANRFFDLEKSVLGDLKNKGGPLAAGLKALFEDGKAKALEMQAKVLAKLQYVALNRFKTVEQWRAEAVAVIETMKGELVAGRKDSDETGRIAIGISKRHGAAILKEVTAPVSAMASEAAAARAGAKDCLADAEYHLRDLDKCLFTLEDFVRNASDPTQGRLAQTNAERAFEKIQALRTKSNTYMGVMWTELTAMQGAEKQADAKVADAVNSILGAAKSVQAEVAGLAARIDTAEEPAQIKELHDGAHNLFGALDRLLEEARAQGVAVFEACEGSIVSISDQALDILEAALRLGAIKELAEEEEADRDALGTVPTDDDENAPEEGRTGGDGDVPPAPAGEIAQAVGAGAPNSPADVDLIKGLLNDFSTLLSFPNLALDGKADKALIDTINQFQALVCKIRPDGVISPGRTTFKALKAGPGAVKDDFPTAREDGDTTEYAPNVTGDIAGVKDHIINVLEEVSSHYKGAKIHVTSGLRDADDQARVMWNYWTTNLKRGEIYGHLRRNPDVLKALQDHYTAGEEAEFKRIIVQHAASLSDHLYGRAVDVPINLNPKLVAAISTVLRKVVEKSCIHFDDRDRTVSKPLDPAIKARWPQ